MTDTELPATKLSDGGPAFPSPLTGKWAGSGASATFAPDSTEGMSLRDLFAGVALQGLSAQSDLGEASLNYHHTGDSILHEQHCRNMAFVCYSMADAMLTERNK